jgi:uncharacterized protein
MATIGITGGTGFIGRHITGQLSADGHNVVIFTRSTRQTSVKQSVTYSHWDPIRQECDIAALSGLDAVINLAGAGIADKRWTKKRKQEILDSLVSRLKEHAPNCKVFIGASAMGFYGPDRANRRPFTETDPAGNDFLAIVCRHWEAESLKAADFARTIIFRFGIVMGRDGGALPRLIQPLSFGIKPILGSGRQKVSWIAVDDLARLMLFAIGQDRISGIYNAVAPEVVTHSQLMNVLAKTKGGFHIPIPVPAFLLQALLGEMSTELLKSSTISAAKTEYTGFKFNYTHLESAIKALISK